MGIDLIWQSNLGCIQGFGSVIKLPHSISALSGTRGQGDELPCNGSHTKGDVQEQEPGCRYCVLEHS